MIEVAIGVIYHDDNYLLAYREQRLHEGGKLEFVGGKIQQGETSQTALIREVEEEIGLDIGDESICYMGEICHDYEDRSVRLFVYTVELSCECYNGFRFRDVGKQGQALHWYDKKTLLTLADRLPRANITILQWLSDESY